MTSWDVLTCLCNGLAAELLGADSRAPREHPRYAPLMELAQYHAVAPAIAYHLRRSPHFSAQELEHLKSLVAHNTIRNLRILSELDRLGRLCHAVNIEPIVLKGAAHLLDGLYPLPGLRVIGDIDILVEGADAAVIDAALRGQGRSAQADSKPISYPHHHLPPLAASKSDIKIEIHTGLTPPMTPDVVSCAWFSERTRSVAVRGVNYRLADPTRAVAHNIAHGQLNHGLHREGYVELRQLLDLCLLRRRHEAEIDWDEIEHRFVACGVGEVLASNLKLAEDLFGLPMPMLRTKPHPRATEAFRALVEQPGRHSAKRLRGIGRNYWTLFRRNPLGVVNLLAPGSWRPRIRMVANSLRSPRG